MTPHVIVIFAYANDLKLLIIALSIFIVLALLLPRSLPDVRRLCFTLCIIGIIVAVILCAIIVIADNFR